MAESQARVAFMHKLIEAAKSDERIVGLLDYGSSSEGRVDEWSDVDVSVFIRDEDFEAFSQNWKTWAGQFGELLLAYIGVVGHPWVVYGGKPVPLRVDFDFHRELEMERVPDWPNSPLSIESMMLYDGTGGQLPAYVSQLVGRSLRPDDEEASFQQVCGDFWYYLLYVYCKLQRGQHWFARWGYDTIVLGNLYSLLRLEAGSAAIEHWKASVSAWRLEQFVSPERLTQLETCIADRGEAGLRQALGRTASFGQKVCATIARQHEWQWPVELARRVMGMLDT